LFVLSSYGKDSMKREKRKGKREIREWGVGSGQWGVGSREWGMGIFVRTHSAMTTRNALKQQPLLPTPNSLLPIAGAKGDSHLF